MKVPGLASLVAEQGTQMPSPLLTEGIELSSRGLPDTMFWCFKVNMQLPFNERMKVEGLSLDFSQGSVAEVKMASPLTTYFPKGEFWS